MASEKLTIHNLLHLSHVELRVGDPVAVRIPMRIGDRLRHALHAHHLTRPPGQRQGNCTRPRV